MKRILTIIVIIGVLGMSSVVYAATYFENIKVCPNTASVIVNGQKIDTDNFNYNGTIYVPLRAVSEKMGGVVEWEQSTQSAKIFSKSEQNNTIDNKKTLELMMYSGDCILLEGAFDCLLDTNEYIRSVLANPYLQTTDNYNDIEKMLKDNIDTIVETEHSISNPNVFQNEITKLGECLNKNQEAWHYYSGSNSVTIMEKLCDNALTIAIMKTHCHTKAMEFNVNARDNL